MQSKKQERRIKIQYFESQGRKAIEEEDQPLKESDLAKIPIGE